MNQKVRKKMFNLLKVILAMMHVVAFAVTLVSLTNSDGKQLYEPLEI
jgi:hypothetical protein